MDGTSKRWARPDRSPDRIWLGGGCRRTGPHECRRSSDRRSNLRGHRCGTRRIDAPFSNQIPVSRAMGLRRGGALQTASSPTSTEEFGGPDGHFAALILTGHCRRATIAPAPCQEVPKTGCFSRFPGTIRPRAASYELAQKSGVRLTSKGWLPLVTFLVRGRLNW